MASSSASPTPLLPPTTDSTEVAQGQATLDAHKLRADFPIFELLVLKRVRALSWERRLLAEAAVRNGVYRLELPEEAAVERVVALDADGSPVGAVPS